MKNTARMMFISVVCAIAMANLACSKEKAAAPGTHSASSDKKGDNKESHQSGAQHAGATADPGSHEDWCGEHGVPESQCSRCNPSLIAAFKATGDWCDEHGLPESQCLKCNPSLQIIRPPAAGGSSGTK